MVLTVQSTGNQKFRLGISLKDSKEIFKKRGVCVNILMPELNIYTKTTCGPPLNKGFDLYKDKLSKWIIENGYNFYEKGNPTRLNFDYKQTDGVHTLKFLGVSI